MREEISKYNSLCAFSVDLFRLGGPRGGPWPHGPPPGYATGRITKTNPQEPTYVIFHIYSM